MAVNSNFEKTNDGFISVGTVHLDVLPDAALDAQGNINDPDILTTGHNLVDWNLVGRHLYHADPKSLSLAPNCNESYLSSTDLARQVAHLQGGTAGQLVLPEVSPPIPEVAGLRLEAGVDSMAAVDLPYVNSSQEAGTVARDPVRSSLNPRGFVLLPPLAPSRARPSTPKPLRHGHRPERHRGKPRTPLPK